MLHFLQLIAIKVCLRVRTVSAIQHQLGAVISWVSSAQSVLKILFLFIVAHSHNSLHGLVM